LDAEISGVDAIIPGVVAETDEAGIVDGQFKNADHEESIDHESIDHEFIDHESIDHEVNEASEGYESEACVAMYCSATEAENIMSPLIMSL